MLNISRLHLVMLQAPSLTSTLRTIILLIGVMLLPLTTFSQTTTLSTETINNTSACVAGSSTSSSPCTTTFPGQTDNRAGVLTPLYDPSPANVSKENVHELLYSGATTSVFANFKDWFCLPGASAGPNANGVTTQQCQGTIVSNYTSDDATTMARQVDDMISRGFNGAVVDWYGQGSREDNAALQLQSNLFSNHCRGPQNCDLLYALEYDGGTLKFAVTPTNIKGTWGNACALNADASTAENCIVLRIRNDVCYMNGKHFGNNSYYKYSLQGGPMRPIIAFFIDEASYSGLPLTGPAPSWTDVWVQIRKWTTNLGTNCSVAPFNANNGDPLLIFPNAEGFTHDNTTNVSDGAFASPSTNAGVSNQSNQQLSALDNFYAASLQYLSTKIVWGAGYKGFNDVQAAWSPAGGRIVDQACGLTWMNSMLEENHDPGSGPYYSTSRQLPVMQVATWNDYDDGAEIETGIDNCVTGFSASVSGTILNWSVSFGAAGSEQTIHHYDIFDSSDGQNLTLVATLPRGSHSVDLSTLTLGSGTRQLYVKATGMPSVVNHMSNEITYTPPPPPPQPAIAFNPANGIGFGNQLVGTTSSPQTETITNSGNASLTISGISLTGVNASDFQITSNTCPSSLAAGASCSLQVTFRPSSTGGRSGAISVSDDANGSPQSVPLTGTGTSSAQGGIPSSSHVVLVILENHSFCDVDPSDPICNTPGVTTPMPWLVGEGNQYGFASNYHADQSGSLLDYLWLTGGSGFNFAPWNCTGSGCGQPVDADNIFRELIARGIPWREYMESYSGWPPQDQNFYVRRHDPASWFTDITTSPAQQNNIVNFSQFATDISASGSLPKLSIVVPNLCNDAHGATGCPAGGGTLGQADNWLKQNIGPLLNNSAFQSGGDGILFITFDECDAASTGNCNNHPEQVYTAVIGPNVRRGFESTTSYKHENVLRTMLDALQVSTYPGASNTSADMADFFQQPPPPPPPGALTLSPSTADFGSSNNVGVDSSPQSFTLSNSGSSSSSVSIQFTGADPHDFVESDTCGTSLAAGASCNINVTFHAWATHSRTATLSVNSGAQTASVSGTASAAFADIDNDAIQSANCPTTQPAHAWLPCNQKAGTGNATATASGVDSTTIQNSWDGTSKHFGFTSSPQYSGMLWSDTMQYFSASTDAIIANNNNFVYSFDFFIPAGQQDIPQAVEFDLNVNRAGNGKFTFATQCDYQGGVGTGTQRFKWDIWTFATNAGGSWQPTDAPCNHFTANSWHHVEWLMQKDETNKQMIYKRLTIDGVPVLTNPVTVPAGITSAETIAIDIQMDINVNGNPWDEYLDNVNVSVLP